MDATSLLAVASAVAAGSAIVLSVVDKLPFVQNNKRLRPWVDEANAIAGELRLALPQGTTLAQAEAAATARATALVTKYAGGPTQAEAVTQIMGTLGSIVEDGHILPATAAPAEDAIMAELKKIQAALAAASVAPAADLVSQPALPALAAPAASPAAPTPAPQPAAAAPA
jgi:hypothetical protein